MNFFFLIKNVTFMALVLIINAKFDWELVGDLDTFSVFEE